jgi:hypothetical protein
MKVGGGGSEKYMVMVPLFVGLVLSIYALGGPGRAFFLIEQFMLNAWESVRNFVR